MKRSCNFFYILIFTGTLIPATLFAVIAIMSDYDLKYMVAIIVLFCLIDCICDLGYCGSYLPSLIDIAPNYTGILSGIATSIANLPFIINAQIFGYLKKVCNIKQFLYERHNFFFSILCSGRRIRTYTAMESFVVHLFGSVCCRMHCLHFIWNISQATLGIIVYFSEITLL